VVTVPKRRFEKRDGGGNRRMVVNGNRIRVRVRGTTVAGWVGEMRDRGICTVEEGEKREKEHKN